MKVLVTGGTGFVGREIMRQLHDAGCEVHILARGSRAGGMEATRIAVMHVGEVLDAKSLGDVCRGMDAVIHLVGIIGEVGTNTFEAVHVQGTRNMLTASREAGVKRFVHMSALGTRANAVSRYHHSKWKAEEFVRASGLDWTIFRPSIIYGPGDGFVNLFAKIIRRSPVVPIIGDGKSKFQPVPVASVAKAFVQALAEPRAIGRAFDLCGPETLSLNQIIDEILHMMRKKRLKAHVPITIARIQAALMEIVFAKFARKAPPLSRDQIVMLQENNVGDGQPAAELLNLQFAPFKDGIARYLNPQSAAGQVSMP
jgi:uncharacterized protein YbjT (DUF2867 family)